MGISQITTVKGRCADVLYNLPRWLSTDIDELVIVDYACPNMAYREIMKSKHFKDPRVRIVRVSPQVSGPFYNHSHARNIGVQASRNQWIVFVDVDAIAFSSYIDLIKSIDSQDLSYDIVCNISKEMLQSPSLLEKLPPTWISDGQFAIKNAVFYSVNGFAEDNPGWGAESYDLFLRVVESTPRFKLTTGGFKCTDHDDKLRDRFLPIRFSDTNTREQAYKKSFGLLSSQRKLMRRAQPGRHFGLTEANPGVVLIKQKSYAPLVPGEV